MARKGKLQFTKKGGHKAHKLAPHLKVKGGGLGCRRPMKSLTRSLLVALLLGILVFSTGGLIGQANQRTATVTVNITILPFQQLRLISNNPAITVQHSGSKQARTEINLRNLTGSSVTLENVITAKILSKVEWRLLVSAEDTYIRYEGQSSTGNVNPTIQLWATDLPSDAVGSNGYTQIPEIGSTQLGRGSALGRIKFGINYRLSAPERSSSTRQW